MLREAASDRGRLARVARRLDLLSEVELLEVVCQVWTDFLGVTAIPIGDAVLPRRALVTSVAGYEGDFVGGLAITLPLAHARQLACNVFMLEEPDLADQDIDDLMVELVTIIADLAAVRSAIRCRVEASRVTRSGMLAGDLVKDGKPMISATLQTADGLFLIRLF